MNDDRMARCPLLCSVRCLPIAFAASLITTLAVLAWLLFPSAHDGARADLLHGSAAMVKTMAALRVRFWWTQAPASA